MVRTEVVEFEWLGHGVRLTSDSQGLIDFVRRMWGRSPATVDRSSCRDYQLLLECEHVLRGPGWEAPLDRSDPVTHAYNLLMTDLHGSIGTHFLFHGTSVVRESRVLLISGPTTFGKTTLGLRLADRGFRLLADDVTAVERVTGHVTPLRRPLNLRPGTRAMLAPDQLEAAENSTLAVYGEEWSVDPAAWSDETLSDTTVSMCVLLRPPSDSTATRRFPFYEIRLARGSHEAQAELETLRGVTDIRPSKSDPWRLTISFRDPAPVSEWLGRRRNEIVSALKLPAGSPGFEGPPRMSRIGPFQAALELCQEMMNRHEGSVLGREFGGREPDLVTEVAGTLRGAASYALSPGEVEATVDTLSGTFDEIHP